MSRTDHAVGRAQMQPISWEWGESCIILIIMPLALALDFSLHRPIIICNLSGTLTAFSVLIANTPLLTVSQRRAYGTDHLAGEIHETIRTVYSCIHILCDYIPPSYQQ